MGSFGGDVPTVHEHKKPDNRNGIIHCVGVETLVFYSLYSYKTIGVSIPAKRVRKNGQIS